MLDIYPRQLFKWFNINNFLVAISSIIIYHLIFQHNIHAFFFFTTDLKQDQHQIWKKNTNSRASSVWCRGENVNQRLCHFHNLCIHSDGEFIFFHGPESIISGMNLSKMKEAVVELSSVEGHNALTLVLTDVPVDRIHDLPWKIKEIENTSLILKRFKPNNLMHVIHDDLMPLHSTLMEIGACSDDKLCNSKLVFVDLFPKGPFWDVYKLFSKSEPIVLSNLNSKEIYCFKDAYVGLNRNTVWYQYGFSVPQSPWTNRTVNAMDIRRFTSFITTSLTGKLIPSTCPPTPLTILLSRKNTRLILNEKKISKIIEKQTTTTVITLSLDDHSLVDLIAHIRCAKILVGMHGALLVLAAFLPPRSILIELFPFAVPPEDYTPYKTLATLPGMGITYKCWVNKKEENTVSHPDWPKQLGGLGHLPIKVQERIKAEKSVKAHLCCSDPQWLFRIFQDTFVDVESFSQVLMDAVVENDVVNSEFRVVNELDDLWRKNLLPGRVNNLSCLVDNENVVLSWDPPWNLKVLDVVDLVYEVWFRVVDDAHYKLLLTNATVQSIKKYNLPFNVWVRSKMNGEKRGPFQWIECK